MEIKVRYLRKDIVKKIDSLAKEKGYKSRNEFLAKKIEDIASENESNKLEKDYLNLMNSLTEITKNHTKVLGSFMDQFIIDADKAYNLDLSYDDIKKDIEKKSDNLYIEEDTSRLIIKKIPVNVIARINEICEERSISQNDFLIKYLSQLTYSNSLKLVNEKYEYSIEKVLGLLDFTTKVLALFYDENYIDTSSFYEGEEV